MKGHSNLVNSIIDTFHDLWTRVYHKEDPVATELNDEDYVPILQENEGRKISIEIIKEKIGADHIIYHVFGTIPAGETKITLTHELLHKEFDTYHFLFQPNGHDIFPIRCKRYIIDTDAGTLFIEIVREPTVDTNIRIDITEFR